MFSELSLELTGIDWVIAGGGSDIYAEPFHVEWALKLRDVCRDAGSAFFFKQLGRNLFFKGNSLKLVDQHGGDWSEWPEQNWKTREIPSEFRELE